MKRNFGNLGGGSAAAVNAGTIGIQKNKVVYLDPTVEILYDPADNVRNGELVDDSIEGLIALRLSMDSEQLQPIRVYPLPPEKLDPKKPGLKYGIGFGHRRTLCCRLTKKDHPDIGEMPRKVEAIIDVDWMKRGPAYRLRCKIQENTERLDLNYVELGQAIHSYRQEVEKEEGRSVPQRELQETFHIREKTLGNLLQAAEFHELTKTACNRKVLTDLDALVTFDSICKNNEDFATAVYGSLLDESAPRSRALIRQAKAKIESEPDFKVDPQNWVWPESVAAPVIKPTPAPAANTASGETTYPASLRQQTVPAGADTPKSDGAGGGLHVGGETAPVNTGSPSRTLPQGDSSGSTQHTAPAPAQPPATGPTVPQQQVNGQASVNGKENGAGASAKGPIIMVSFKMGAEAKETFTGELLLDRKAKATSSGVVAYLQEGCEETIEVPLKYVELVSIFN